MSATFDDVRNVITKLRTAGRPPEKIFLTPDQLESVAASVPLTLRTVGGVWWRTRVIGLPVEIVKGVEDSTLWLQELL